MATSSTTRAMATTMGHLHSPNKEAPMDEGALHHEPTTAIKITILAVQLLDLLDEAAIRLVAEGAR